MKIQYASDLHLEFFENSLCLETEPLQVTGEVLVLAGDIALFGARYTEHSFWDWASDNYERVIAIPGNHELYKFHDINTLHDGWTLQIRDNVHCVYNTVIPLADDIDLIATTLWSRISPQRAAVTVRGVADFHRIKMGDRPLDAARFNREHERCLAFLKDAVAASKAEHIVVATHHVPSFQLNAPEYRDSPVTGAFTVELEDFIESSPIECWIYGHSHRNIDALIGGTRCVSNQMGYVSHNEHQTFDRGKVIEIG